MTTPDMLSINNVAAKLGLSVHQLRRWELMFGLEIKRGRGQQRQYRDEDLSVLERIKELVEQGWPTSQIRPQLEAEGLVSPKLIGVTPSPGNPEVLQESIIGLRNFTERRFIEISKQIDELRQLLISVTLKQELSADKASPWQPTASEYMPAPKIQPAQEITIGPQISIDPPGSNMYGGSGLLGRPQANPAMQQRTSFEPSSGNEAVSRSMSALDSMFRDNAGKSESAQETRPEGYTKTPIIPPPDATASSSNLNAVPPVRHSTIPPLPPQVAAPEPAAAASDLSSSAPETMPETSSQTADSKSESAREASAAAASVANWAAATAVDATPVEPAGAKASSAEPGSEDSPVGEVTEGLPAMPSGSAPTDTISTAAIPAVTTETSYEDQFAATSVDFQALPGESLTSESTASEPKFTAPSQFSVPPLPPNPFKASTESSEAAQANLRSLFAPSAPEPPQTLGGYSDYGSTQASSSAAQAASGPSSQEVTAEDLSSDHDLFGQAGQASDQAALAEQAQAPIQLTPGPQVNFGPNVSAPTAQATPQRVDDNFGLGEVTDQNYLTVLGRALDLIGWTDEQADSYSLKTFGVPHWDELGRSQAEKLVAHLIGLLKEQLG